MLKIFIKATFNSTEQYSHQAATIYKMQSYNHMSYSENVVDAIFDKTKSTFKRR